MHKYNKCINDFNLRNPESCFRSACPAGVASARLPVLRWFVGIRSFPPPPQSTLRVLGKRLGRSGAIAAKVCGALFIGYCIYFDRRRRSDPNLKNRLPEERKKQKLAEERVELSKFADLKDAEAAQKFFLEETQLW